MQYIIERDIDRDRWCVMLPVWHTTDHGVRYLVYDHDAASSLHGAVAYAYDHRAAYSNWDCVILINGREVLYCEDVTDGIVIRYMGGKSITVMKENK